MHEVTAGQMPDINFPIHMAGLFYFCSSKIPKNDSHIASIQNKYFSMLCAYPRLLCNSRSQRGEWSNTCQLCKFTTAWGKLYTDEPASCNLSWNLWSGYAVHVPLPALLLRPNSHQYSNMPW